MFAAAFFAVQRCFIIVASFARASGLSCRFAFLVFGVAVADPGLPLAVDSEAFDFFPGRLATNFRRSFASFLVSLEMLASSRRIRLFKFFCFMAV